MSKEIASEPTLGFEQALDELINTDTRKIIEKIRIQERSKLLKELEAKIEAYIEKEKGNIAELEEEGEDEMGHNWTGALITNCENRIDGATNVLALLREEEEGRSSTK
jgi:vacuolar-type H+-ATPase subunit E/Vma4